MELVSVRGVDGAPAPVRLGSGEFEGVTRAELMTIGDLAGLTGVKGRTLTDWGGRGGVEITSTGFCFGEESPIGIGF
jgi:hypothetical protein